MKTGDIKRMFNPKTVALIGATDKEGAIGRTVLMNLLMSTERKVFAVNPNRKTVMGIDAYKNLASIPEEVDLAVVATPAPMVPDILEDCAKTSIQGVIIVSSGFKETGEEGRKLEERIVEIKKAHGMRIVGPNCLGVIRPAIGLNASFLDIHPSQGNIAFISQSGALGTAILDWAITAHIGFSMFASLGSMLDIDFGDLIDFLGDDPYTRSILVYMEGVGNARKFMSAARGFARNKPIIVLKPGRFKESAKAALSHTGSMAGDDQVYDGAFKRVGVVRIADTGDLFNTAEVLDSRHLPKGRRLAIVTNAGGVGVIATDTVIGLGGQLAVLSEKTIKSLDKELPSFWSKGNPVDVLGDATIERYMLAMNTCIQDPGVDAILMIYTPQGPAIPVELARATAALAEKAGKPIIATWMGGKTIEEAKEVLIHSNIPTYVTPEEAVKTYLYMYKYGRNLELLYETPADLPVDQAPPKNNLKALIKKSIKEGRTVLSEVESKRFLSAYGIPTIRTFIALSVHEAVNVAETVGYPVVMKILSPDITHKTDIGGVVVGINSEEALKREYAALMENVKKKAPQADITSVTIQKMLEKIDYEIILGAKKDNDFGSVIVFGLGGIGTEIMKSIGIALPPLNQTLARRLIEDSGIYKMLQGYRGKQPADMRLLEQAIVSFSNLIIDFPEIAEMDINPIGVSKGKPFALDARIIVDPSNIDAAPYKHLVLTPYPSRYIVSWRMNDGQEITLRPIRPEDEPLEYELLTTLSEKSMRERFFQTIMGISHEMLVRFCNIDYEREMAIIAELKAGEKKKIIGIGRLVNEPDMKNAEFAVVVHDDYQGKGLGYKLMDVLIGIAQDKNLNSIYGIVLSDNERMLRATRRLGFVPERASDGLTRVVLELNP
ncbi:MAG TPA: bifunctional acetate--CoA ligase family protein/GNAT family N-acetyltransferase [Syntrophorhabdaceae bacterium]|nr:bifunctional acetate--CoA ligase family protein/GNAT family N-acetyltransferase [Syntrophorhabdaceae bacterium]